jgi:NAD(P)-dependent dehydrogenase (short-subunit alcohol dehydrogenase family)
MSAFDLTGRIVLLTGAAGHLGHAMSQAILLAGADLIMVGRRAEALSGERDRLATHLRAHCHFIACDITQADAANFLKREVNERFGRLHGIVNNAYAGKVGTLETIGRVDFLEACTYNLVAPFELVKAFAPLLEQSAEQDRVTSSVVNVASMYGVVSPDPAVYGNSGTNNPAHYGATKAGMIQLSRYLACHLGRGRIRVNSVSPGPFPNIGDDPEALEFYEKLALKVPMGRVGRPEEAAAPVVFLLSEAASYVNGANLPIDGGWTAW